MTEQISPLRDFVWKTFEYTGSIHAYALYKEIQDRKPSIVEELQIEEQVLEAVAVN